MACRNSPHPPLQDAVQGSQVAQELKLPDTLPRVHAHWLDQACRIPSPFHDDRPLDTQINLLVIHSISLPEGHYGTDYVRQLFMGEINPQGPCAEIANLRVSSHLFIPRDGSLVQFVAFNKRAWHAGVSCYDNVESCNDYSIGIELEGTDSDCFTPAQYQSLVQATRALLHSYPKLSTNRIVGHSDIALPPGRKTDPGSGMDWNTFRQLLSTHSNSAL